MGTIVNTYAETPHQLTAEPAADERKESAGE
jgi:hypothetical protein